MDSDQQGVVEGVVGRILGQGAEDVEAVAVEINVVFVAAAQPGEAMGVEGMDQQQQGLGLGGAQGSRINGERITGRAAVIGAEEVGGGHGGGCWAVDAQKGMSSWRVTAWISASLTKIVSSAPTNSITSCDRSIHRNLDQDHCLGAWIDGIRA